MPLPKRRHSNTRTANRRAHDALKKPSLYSCKNCGEVKRPHTVCPNCGHYAGREVVKTEE
ncbi:MAG TPA: 50S ribosomal protein L32 [Planctomycetota bacterium]|nr:50S ribosomal protein L32 [Planctomycetota bacterium]